MATKQISTQTAGQVLDATHFLQLASHPVVIFDIEGEVNSTTGTSYYIQLHTSAPGANQVPLYSRLVVPSVVSSGLNGFSFIYRPQGINTATMAFPSSGVAGGANNSPVFVAISSTGATYTSVGASTNVAVTLEDIYLELGPLTISGDATTQVGNLVVFADPNAAKRLIAAQVVNTNGTAIYAMLFAYSPVVTGALPLQQWKIAANTTINLHFDSGLGLQQLDAQNGLHTGCNIVISSTTQTATVGVSQAAIKAWNL
jgi:hypothetical protein